MNKLIRVISLILATCLEFPSGVKSQTTVPPPPIYDGTSRFDESCNRAKGKICYSEERTICIPVDPSISKDEGKCLCPGIQAFILNMDEQVAKVYDHKLSNDVADIDPAKLAEILPFLIRRCADYKIEGQPCGPKYPKPVPQADSERHIHPLDYHPLTKTLTYNRGFFPNTGCMSHETNLDCDNNGICRCLRNMLQNSIGLCATPTTSTARYIGDACNDQLRCWPIQELLCDGLTKKCICKDPNKEWFLGIQNFYIPQPLKPIGRCVQTRRHNTLCNSKVFDWCSPKLGLKCYEGFCKCKMYPEMVWLDSEKKCLIAEGRACLSHESCANRFCYENICRRQLAQGARCETGLDQQCSSGFCDKKVCRYRVIPTTSLGNRREAFNFLNTVLFMLPVSTWLQLRPI